MPPKRSRKKQKRKSAANSNPDAKISAHPKASFSQLFASKPLVVAGPSNSRPTIAPRPLSTEPKPAPPFVVTNTLPNGTMQEEVAALAFIDRLYDCENRTAYFEALADELRISKAALRRVAYCCRPALWHFHRRSQREICLINHYIIIRRFSDREGESLISATSKEKPRLMTASNVERLQADMNELDITNSAMEKELENDLVDPSPDSDPELDPEIEDMLEGLGSEAESDTSRQNIQFELVPEFHMDFAVDDEGPDPAEIIREYFENSRGLPPKGSIMAELTRQGDEAEAQETRDRKGKGKAVETHQIDTLKSGIKTYRKSIDQKVPDDVVEASVEEYLGNMNEDTLLVGESSGVTGSANQGHQSVPLPSTIAKYVEMKIKPANLNISIDQHVEPDGSLSFIVKFRFAGAELSGQGIQKLENSNLKANAFIDQTNTGASVFEDVTVDKEAPDSNEILANKSHLILALTTTDENGSSASLGNSSDNVADASSQEVIGKPIVANTSISSAVVSTSTMDVSNINEVIMPSLDTNAVPVTPVYKVQTPIQGITESPKNTKSDVNAGSEAASTPDKTHAISVPKQLSSETPSVTEASMPDAGVSTPTSDVTLVSDDITSGAIPNLGLNSDLNSPVSMIHTPVQDTEESSMTADLSKTEA